MSPTLASRAGERCVAAGFRFFLGEHEAAQRAYEFNTIWVTTLFGDVYTNTAFVRSSQLHSRAAGPQESSQRVGEAPWRPLAWCASAPLNARAPLPAYTFLSYAPITHPRRARAASTSAAGLTHAKPFLDTARTRPVTRAPRACPCMAPQPLHSYAPVLSVTHRPRSAPLMCTDTHHTLTDGAPRARRRCQTSRR